MSRTDQSAPQAPRAGSAAVALAIAILGILSYRASFGVPFVLDDLRAIRDEAAVHADSLEPAALWRATHLGRPLAYVSFAINHAVGGLDPFGYHLVNLAFHLASAFLVHLVALRLLAVAAADLSPRSRFRAAAVTALVFAVHPVHTQAVTYVVQRMASMGAFFGLLSTLAWLRARAGARRPGLWLAGAGAAWVLALLCKENFVVLPAVLGAADALLFGGWRQELRRRWVPLAASATVLAALAATMLWRARHVIATEYARFGVSPVERLLTEPSVIWHYLSLLLLPLPSRLHIAYDWPVARSLIDRPSTLPAILGLVALVGFAWVARRRWPVVAFAVLWWLGNLSVESSILPLDLAFDHRVYFPSLGPLLLAAWGLEVAAARLRFPPWAVVVPVVLLLAVATDRRNAAWNDPLLLYQQADDAGLASEAVLDGLMSESYVRGRLEDAERTAHRILERNPDSALALTTLGHIALDRGDPARAERLFVRAIDSNSGALTVWYGLAQAMALQGRAAEAEELLVRRTRASPRDSSSWTALAVLRAQRGDRAAARAALDAAISANPADPVAWRYRAALSMSEGNPEAALRDLREVLALRPGDGASRVELGDALAALGRTAEARAAWEKALALDPLNEEARRRLGGAAVRR